MEDGPIILQIKSGNEAIPTFNVYDPHLDIDIPFNSTSRHILLSRPSTIVYITGSTQSHDTRNPADGRTNSRIQRDTASTR